MKLNTAPAFDARTHEGAKARPMTPLQALRRSVSSAFLWEREFYEDGQDIAKRVLDIASSRDIAPEDLAALAIELREDHNLRHMPLLLLSVLARRGAGRTLVADTIARTIRRPDEMGELLAIHARLNGVGPDRLKKVTPAQMKKGLARAFTGFDAYQLGKYDRAAAVRLRDVMFLTHPEPRDAEQKAVWEKLIAGTLEAPDTWEVSLSGGADKGETFTRLLREGKLGYMALLRNLRNMDQAGVDGDLVRKAILARRGAHRILPFRYIAAARACPRFEPALDEALAEAVAEMPVPAGRTIVLVDVSASMNAPLSARSDLSRRDAAAGLAAILPGDKRVFSFSNDLVEVPPRMGMAGVDAITGSQPNRGTYLGKAVREVSKMAHDRIVVITDEQSHDPVPDPSVRDAYMINVASAQNGVGYGAWRHIDGFSENVFRFIHEIEALEAEDVPA